MPDKDGSYTEYRFYILYNKPIDELELADVRFLIGQNAGLKFLVPIAVEYLRGDAFLETEYYPGDLLMPVLQISNTPIYWLSNKVQKEEIVSIYNSQMERLFELDLSQEIIYKIMEAFKSFSSTEH